MHDLRVVLWGCAVLTGLAAPPYARSQLVFPIDQVEPGMTGYGLSVFQKDRIDTFQVAILGVQRGAYPEESVILARLSGQNLEVSGVVAGMSGSPVYLDGKLLGAVASGWPYSKEAIAGITPIKAMLELEHRPSGSTSEATPLHQDGLPEQAARWRSLWTSSGQEVLNVLIPARAEAAQGWSPLQTPLAMSGFSPKVAQSITPWLHQRGFLPVQSAGGGALHTSTEKRFFRPGGSLAVPLVRGDAELSAVGTVTWVEGAQVFGLGHPLFNRGDALYPLSHSEIISVMPSVFRSFKIGVSGPVVGAVTHDYHAGILGTVGASVNLIPMSMTLHTPAGVKDYKFELLDAERFTSLIVGLLTSNAAVMADRAQGAVTLETLLNLQLADGRTLTKRNLLSGFAPPLALAGEVARSVAIVHENPAETVSIEGIHVDVNITDAVSAAWLDRLEVSPGPHHPGSALALQVWLHNYRGDTWVEEFSVDIPETAAPGALVLTVCDGNSAGAMERDRTPGRFTSRNLDHILESLGSEPAADAIVLRLNRASTNPVIAGEELPNLPRSWSKVFSSPLSQGRVSLAKSTVIQHEERRLGKILFGCLTAGIEIAGSEEAK